MSETKDYYSILGIPRNASPEEIKKAWQLLALKYHPDRHPNNELAYLAAEKYKEIQEAYDVLIDDDKRKAYNPNPSTYDNNNIEEECRKHIETALQYCLQQMFDEAHEELDIAEKMNPNNPYVSAARGIIYVKANEYVEAIPIFEEALSKSVIEAVVYYNYGIALIATGFFSKAIDMINRAIKIDGEKTEYLEALVIANNKNSQENKAWEIGKSNYSFEQVKRAKESYSICFWIAIVLGVLSGIFTAGLGLIVTVPIGYALGRFWGKSAVKNEYGEEMLKILELK